MTKKKKLTVPAIGDAPFAPTVYDDPKTLHRMLENKFRDQDVQARRMMKEHNVSEPDFQLGEPWRTRRIKAIEHYIPVIKDRYAEKYPDIHLEEDFAATSSVPIACYDMQNVEDHFDTAAAIWILDTLKDCSLLYLVYPYLPLDVGYDEVEMPNIRDLCHSKELIRSMVSLIQTRNSDLYDKESGSTSRKAAKFNPYRTFMDTFTAEGKQDCESHCNYRAVLDLLPQKAIDTAVRHFREKVDEWMDIYYRIIEGYAAKEREQERRIVALAKQAIKERETVIAAANSRNVLAMQDVVSGIIADTQSKYSSLDFMERQSDRSLSEVSRLHFAHEAILARKQFFKANAFAFDRIAYETAAENMGAEAAELLSEFTVENPYEICFALLYLIEQDDDLPWLYYFPLAVVERAAQMLPWAKVENDGLCDPAWDIDDEPDAVVTRRRFEPDWYRMEYSTGEAPDAPYVTSTSANLAQIVYEFTGMILPRNVHRYDYVKDELKQRGSDDEQIAQAMILIMLLGESKYRSSSPLDFLDDYDDDFPEGDEEYLDEADAVKPLSEQTAELRAEIARLKKELDYYKEAAHTSMKTARETAEQLEILKRQAALDRRELADLRELVFNQQNDPQEETRGDTDVAFPYAVHRRIIVFGGHDTWAKEMRPRLPDVRFIDRDALPNAEMIRNADTVWIQPNSLAHKHFYKIIDIVRQRNIPVRYFSYASAEKCALQIVEEERSRKT